MTIVIGGDTLALDQDVRRQIESEAEQLFQRFPEDSIQASVTIQEHFDPLHGHRIRCEFSARIDSGRQVIVREARKTAADAIRETFTLARRNIRKLRRPPPLDTHRLPTKPLGVVAQA